MSLGFIFAAPLYYKLWRSDISIKFMMQEITVPFYRIHTVEVTKQRGHDISKVRLLWKRSPNSWYNSEEEFFTSEAKAKKIFNYWNKAHSTDKK